MPRFPIIATVCFTLACGSSSARRLVESATVVPGTTFSLDSLIPGAWDRLYVFGPYTPIDTIRAYAGRTGAWSYHKGTDTEAFLVFARDGEPSISFPVPRSPADWVPSVRDGGYLRPNVRFTVEQRSTGLAIVPAVSE